jgi:hypothetical protein
MSTTDTGVANGRDTLLRTVATLRIPHNEGHLSSIADSNLEFKNELRRHNAEMERILKVRHRSLLPPPTAHDWCSFALLYP